MKIKNKTMAIAILIILSLGLFFYIIKIPSIQERMFSGNRITINLKVMLNGQEISLDRLNASCFFENENCTVASENGIYKTIGGEYGQYKFELLIPKERLEGYAKDISVNLDYINSNSWYISQSDCVLALYTDNTGLVYGNTTVAVKYNDGTSQEYKEDVLLLDNVITINWGL